MFNKERDSSMVQSSLNDDEELKSTYVMKDSIPFNKGQPNITRDFNIKKNTIITPNAQVMGLNSDTSEEDYNEEEESSSFEHTPDASGIMDKSSQKKRVPKRSE